MRVVLDQGTPAPLRRLLPGHDVATAFELGWATLTNGEFLAAAEDAGFEAVITTDKNLRHQQSVRGRSLGVLVLPTTKWPVVREQATRIQSALTELQPGEITDVRFDD